MTVVSAEHAPTDRQVRNDKVRERRERRRDQQTRDHPQHRAGSTGSLPYRVKAHGEERHDCEQGKEQRGRQQMAGRRGTLCPPTAPKRIAAARYRAHKRNSDPSISARSTIGTFT